MAAFAIHEQQPSVHEQNPARPQLGMFGDNFKMDKNLPAYRFESSIGVY
jgi:hypothetical protein